jgi:hypothetical protein
MISKKCDSTESYSMTAIPKMFPTVAASWDMCIVAKWEHFKGDPSQQGIKYTSMLGIK